MLLIEFELGLGFEFLTKSGSREKSYELCFKEGAYMFSEAWLLFLKRLKKSRRIKICKKADVVDS